ncbi:MAG: translocation/assembly module TamB, partial [Bacteroidaceae bacterium]|nr:translocation/assembly module TamB [Bacteroidaceae bacterium]
NRILDFYLISAYTKSKTPLVLDGKVDCRRLESVVLDLNVKANDFELMNAPKSRNAVAYGKVYVDLMSRITGTPSDLQMRGKLVVLSKTDVNYVLTDSPLTVEDQLADLVTFVDFTEEEDAPEAVVVKPQNIDVSMQLVIEPAAQVHVLLSEDGQNDLNIEGGGDFTLSYSSQNDLKLYGRYTVLSGDLNYSLMVMSLRDCRIKQGSYVEFTGPVTNPRLNITATERVKTTVYEEKVPRSVAFDVGIELSKTLEDMGMNFTIDAPEDLTVSNQLASMGADGRGKVAVTMLATGMYLTDEGSSQGFSGTNALNSFLQTQIAGITNKALKSVDVNIGVDNVNTASGATQTDYNFSFAKRFWGNRISLIVGGKVSSGSEAQNTGQSIVDNVSIEYRLDNSATRYVRLYYDRNTESLIEGEIMEMGAGIVLRKKTTRLGELFIFRKKKEEAGSLK